MRRRHKEEKPPGLMLTSLLDMFTIILIFLIVSFEAEDYNFKLHPDLKLPESSASSVFKPAVNVSITPDAIEVEREEIVPLKNGHASPAQIASQELPALVEVLSVAYERIQQGIDEGLISDEEEDPAIVVVQGDKTLDYGTLYLVLRSASMAGFVRYRLAIMKK